MIKLVILLFTALKFGKIAATGGTMAVSLILYAQIFGWAYAAGFLAGLTSGKPLPVCGRIASIAAAEVISHYGARPQADLKKLAATAA